LKSQSSHSQNYNLMKPKFEFGVIMLASYLVIVEVSTFSRGRCAANYFSQDFLQDKLEVSIALEEKVGS
jgi:hypothetical protein